MTSDFLEILNALHDHRVEFVIVGGVAAVLHGGSRVTFDPGAAGQSVGPQKKGLAEASPVDPRYPQPERSASTDACRWRYVNMPSVSNLSPSTPSDLR